MIFKVTGETLPKVVTMSTVNLNNYYDRKKTFQSKFEVAPSHTLKIHALVNDSQV